MKVVAEIASAGNKVYFRLLDPQYRSFLQEVAEKATDGHPEIEVQFLSFDEFEAMVRSGEITEVTGLVPPEKR